MLAECRHCFADLAPSRKIPAIWKSPALLRLHRLDGTIVSFKKSTLTTGLVNQRQTIPLDTQAGETLDEVVFAEVEMSSDLRDLLRGDLHLARPSAARGATLAGIVDVIRHAHVSARIRRCANGKLRHAGY